MFEPMFESLHKATDLTIQMQQDLFKKWVSLWPAAPGAFPIYGEQAQKFQKKWAEILEETLKKQREALEAQFTAGLKNLDATFKLAEVKDVQELRTRTTELWQKTFKCLQHAFETQLREFQTGVTRWTDLVTKGAA